MTLENTADLIYCQTCANAWEQSDDNGQYYFRSDGAAGDIGDYISPKDIADAGERMTFCPKCDVEQLEPTPIPDAPPGVKGRDPFYEDDDKMIGSRTDAGFTDDGSADVTHDARD